MSKVIAVVLTAVLFLAGILLTGFAFSTLWGWFVVPLGVEPLGLMAAIGIGVMIRMFHAKPVSCMKEHRTPLETMSEAFAHLILTPLIALLVGWFLRLFL